MVKLKNGQSAVIHSTGSELDGKEVKVVGIAHEFATGSIYIVSMADTRKFYNGYDCILMTEMCLKLSSVSLFKPSQHHVVYKLDTNRADYDTFVITVPEYKKVALVACKSMVNSKEPKWYISEEVGDSAQSHSVKIRNGSLLVRDFYNNTYLRYKELSLGDGYAILCELSDFMTK